MASIDIEVLARTAYDAYRRAQKGSVPRWDDLGPAGSRALARTARKRVNKKVVAWSACGIIVPPVLGAAFFTFYGGFLVLFLFTFLGTVMSSRSPVARRPGPASMSSRR